MIQGWTDYPLAAAGDAPGREASVRAARILAYDGDKYCLVEAEGVPGRHEIKRGYLYTAPGRCGEVAPFPHDALTGLPPATAAMRQVFSDAAEGRKIRAARP